MDRCDLKSRPRPTESLFRRKGKGRESFSDEVPSVAIVGNSKKTPDPLLDSHCRSGVALAPGSVPIGVGRFSGNVMTQMTRIVCRINRYLV